ncbi:MAG: NUDIX hydrolase [Erysipelotrichaceae bacterium]|nr:NUDIX hydrolase [Erysipelotrichaceae bacterium]
MDDLNEKTLHKEYLFEGDIIKVRKDKAEMPDGQMVPREVVEHPGGVGIALEDENGKFFFVTQWRYAQEGITLEYPAGKREKGEDDLLTAKREIVEETGYEGTDWVYLGEIYPTPAYDTETIGMYYAKKGKFLGQHLDSDEYINVSELTLDEITDKIVSGEVHDSKTICMTFMVKEFKNRGKI